MIGVNNPIHIKCPCIYFQCDDHCKDLIEKLMKIKPDERMDMDHLLAHKCINPHVCKRNVSVHMYVKYILFPKLVLSLL